MRSLSLAVLLASAGCAAPPRADAPSAQTPTGRAAGRSSWSSLAPGARVKAVTKKGAYVGSFILYHDGVLWLNVDGGNRKSFDALEIARLYVLEAR